MAPLLEPLPFQPSVGFRARRVTFVYPVQVRPLDASVPALRVHSTNLSLSGMFIYAVQSFPVGTRVKIFLEVQGRPLELGDGVVKWVRGTAFASYPWCPGFGVQFAPLRPRSQALVQRLVAAAIEQGERVKPAPLPEVEGIPVPGPSVQNIVNMECPLDDDHATKRMFPVAQAAPPQVEAPPKPAPAPAVVPFAAFAAPGRNGRRWVRWALAAVATAAWVAVFAQARSPSPAPSATAARSAPADARR